MVAGASKKLKLTDLIAKSRRWWPFSLLCAVAWLRLNLQESVPESATTAGSELVGCGIAAALACIVSAIAQSTRPAWKFAGLSAAAGALLLCGPAAALFFDVPLTSAGLVIALALTPVVVAVAIAAGRTAGELTAASLWPGIAAAAGLLLLLPRPSLVDARSDAAWLLAPMCTGIGCVMMLRLGAQGTAWLSAGALVGAAIAFGLVVLLNARERSAFHTLSMSAIGFDAALAGLSVLSVLRLRPLQYSAQYALLPLLVLVEGQVMIRSMPRLRTLCGLVMLAAASVALLSAGNGTEPEQMPSLRM